MGNWYANISVYGVSQVQVLDALREWKRTAFVSTPKRGYVVVYDEDCRRMDGDDSEALAARITERFGCIALIALNADDDVLWLCLYDNGRRIVEYQSDQPTSGAASQLARGMGSTIYTPALWVVIQGKFLFEVWRHLAICKVLGLPSRLCTLGYPAERDGTLSPDVPPGMFASTHDE